MKRILSILLVLAMLVPVTAVASEKNTLPFTDLNQKAWYMESVEYCYSKGYVNGVGNNKFAPNKNLTRAEFVQMLAGFCNAELEKYEDKNSGFKDVKKNQWYNEAICWAVSFDLVAGLSETRFGPNEPITREQLARLFYELGSAFNIYMKPRADLSGYKDASKVSSWAKEEVEWACAAGVISGMSNDILAPRGNATRAQVCRMLMAFDSYFAFGGRDTTGLFRELTDYISEKGTADENDPDSIKIEYKAGEDHCMIVYDTKDDVMYFTYFTGIHKNTVGNTTYISYEERAMVAMYGMLDRYDFDFTYTSNDTTKTAYSVGKMTKDGYTENQLSYDGISKETAQAKTKSAYNKLVGCISDMISETGHSFGELFVTN